MSAPLLQTEGLTLSIGGKQVCQALDLTVERGQCWGILGGNGIGKTTLLHTLAGLRAPDSGRVLLNGTPLANLTRKGVAQQLGVLLQEQHDPFPGTVQQRVLQGRHPHLGRWAWEDAGDLSLAQAALLQVGMSDLAARQLATLSGGEKQRAAIATLLTQAPTLYLLDEPTNHLDLHHQINLLDMLSGTLAAQGRAMIMILHDVNLASRYCDHLLLLFGEGRTLHGPRQAILTSENLSSLYQHDILTLPGPHGSAFLPA